MPKTNNKIVFSLPFKMMEKIKELMKEEQRIRSELLREALRRYIEEKEWVKLLRYGRMKAKKRGISKEQVEDIVDGYRK